MEGRVKQNKAAIGYLKHNDQEKLNVKGWKTKCEYVTGRSSSNNVYSSRWVEVGDPEYPLGL